jgi:hypothetical protein
MKLAHKFCCFKVTLSLTKQYVALNQLTSIVIRLLLFSYLHQPGDEPQLCGGTVQIEVVVVAESDLNRRCKVSAPWLTAIQAQQVVINIVKVGAVVLQLTFRLFRIAQAHHFH